MKKKPSWLVSIAPVILLTCFANAQQPSLVLPLGHTKAIYNIAFSKDGKLVATASEDHTAKVWDVATGLLVADVKGNDGAVFDASFSSDGKKLITSSGDSSVRVWNLSSGQLILEIHEETSLGKAIFSPDGKWILTKTFDRVRLWNANTGEMAASLTGNTVDISWSSFSPDSKFIVTGVGTTATIWDISTGRLLAKFIGSPQKLWRVGFLPDGKSIFTIEKTVDVWDVATKHLKRKLGREHCDIQEAGFSSDGKFAMILTLADDAELWNVATGKLVCFLKGHTDEIYSGSFSPDDKMILTASADHTVKLWNAVSGQLIKNLIGHQGPVRTASFSPDGKWIGSASDDKTARLWNVASGQEIFNLAGHTGRIYNSIFSNDGKRAATSSESNAAQLWEVETGKLLTHIDMKPTDPYIESFSPEGQWVAGILNDSTAGIWNATNGQLGHTLKGFGSSSMEYSRLLLHSSFSPDGKLIMTISRDSMTRIWNASSGALIAAFKTGTGVFSSVFSPDSKIILTSDGTGAAVAWTAQTGKLIASYKENLNDAANALFSPDGKYIIATSYPHLVFIWVGATRQLKEVLVGHSGEVNSAVFSPDGNLVVTASQDSTVKIWNIKTGKMLIDLKGHTGPVRSAVFSPDGNRIVSISDDHTAKIWSLPEGNLLFSVNGEKNEIFTNIDFVNNRILGVNGSETSLYDLKTGARLSTRIVIDSTDYLNRTPAGYYMCTPDAAKLLHYVTRDLKTITFAQLDIKYNRPDKVLESLGNPDTGLINAYRNAYYKRILKLGVDTTSFREGFSAPEADFTNRDNINYNQTHEELRLRIKGSDSVFLLDRFNIWINGVPIFGLRGINIEHRKSNHFDTALTISLSQGINQIETSVTNTNGAESYHSPLLINFQPDHPKKEKLYFVGIGINQFADQKYNLLWSVKDIRDLCLNLKDKYKDGIEIDTLFDENVTVSRVRSLKKKLALSSYNDKVIIAYSGHGLLSSTYDYYLSTYDVNFSNPQQNGLPYEELDNLLDSIPARKKLMLIDACHSGEVDKDEMNQFKELKTRLDSQGIQRGVVIINKDSSKIGMKGSVELMQELFANVSKNTGTTVISAAAGTQFALERNNLMNGVFTYSILEYMREYDHATVNNLKSYVNRRVALLTAGLQVPTTRTENNEQNWQIW